MPAVPAQRSTGEPKRPATSTVIAAVKNLGDGFEDQPQYCEKYDSGADKRDMYRLGRKQELRRRFKYFSIAGYVVVLGNTWEFSIVTSVFSLANGGTAGAIWTTLFVCCGVMLGALSFAEIASMVCFALPRSRPMLTSPSAPAAGGQYHWVSEVAPRRWQKELSYTIGWLVALGWQVAVPAGAYIFAQQILALVALCKPDYVLQGWHAALTTIASAVCTVTMSVYIMRRLTVTQGVSMVMHCSGFIVIIAILWAMGPRANAYDTFFSFENLNGWDDTGLATLVGLVGPAATFLTGDSAVHLAEELQDASYVLPRAMVSGTAFNNIVGAIALISFMFNIGPIDDSLYLYGGQPWVAVIYRITGSKAATIVVLLIVITNFFCIQINMILSSSRQLWAFGRDKGLPFHGFISKVQPNGLPRNALIVTLVFTVLVALIIIGSSAAFAVILSFTVASLYAGYSCILCCMIHRRFDGNHFPPTKFSLGKLGLPINVLALCYFALTFVFLFFPAVPNPDAVSMNWSSLMLGGVVLVAFCWYLFRGRYEYDGPVEYTKQVV